MVSNHQPGTVKIYVEGGGDQNRLKRECRRAFGVFFEKLGFRGRRLSFIIMCVAIGIFHVDIVT